MRQDIAPSFSIFPSGAGEQISLYWGVTAWLEVAR
jgi:hypothetical protein